MTWEAVFFHLVQTFPQAINQLGLEPPSNAEQTVSRISGINKLLVGTFPSVAFCVCSGRETNKTLCLHDLTRSLCSNEHCGTDDTKMIWGTGGERWGNGKDF